MKKPPFSANKTLAPAVNSLSEANALIQPLWQRLCEYEDRLAANSRNSSRSPSSDSPAAKAERKKRQRRLLHGTQPRIP